MDTPTTETSSPTSPPRNTFRTVGEVVHHVRELIKVSVSGLQDLAAREDLSEREQLTVNALANLRQQTNETLGQSSNDWAGKIEHTWTQYPVVFQVSLTLRNELKAANSALEANRLLSQVDETLISALTSLKESNPAISDFCESVVDVLFQLERKGSIAINGEQDM